jgi:3-deoxy-D-manno-octulosonate 8-phosphate phosphatase (KDO 8-P phosphatase)
MDERAKNIKLLILDVDGVLTDGRIIYDNFGDELKFFNVSDGLGMTLLSRTKIKSVIITAKKTKIVRRRARDMGVAALFSDHNKLKVYNKVIKRFKVTDKEVCFIGDDLLDLPVLKRAGFSAAPPNAAKEVLDSVHYVTKKEGGKGAVRELIEIILKSQGLWDKIVSKYLK